MRGALTGLCQLKYGHLSNVNYTLTQSASSGYAGPGRCYPENFSDFPVGISLQLYRKALK